MNKIEQILSQSIKDLIEYSSSNKKLSTLRNKNIEKVHFIPFRYRVFGGILQSMNIQFGNFIEKIMQEIINENSNNEIITEFSNSRRNNFLLTKKSDELIDKYITLCQTSNFNEEHLKSNFNLLIQQIKSNESDLNNETSKFNHDVDVLFRNKTTNKYYYVEIKFNDDHDSGKYVDINRKFLKTYAYLQRKLGININLNPILFYFNNIRLKGNIYLPENIIYRGSRFFDEFTTIKYEDIDKCMKSISESPETIKTFDELYKKVMGQ